MRYHQIIGWNTFAFLVLTLLLCTPTHAKTNPLEEEPPKERTPKKIHPEELPSYDHIEFTMGFIGGYKNYSNVPFSYEKGGGQIPGHASLTKPFQQAPYNGVPVMGLRWEGRVVFSYIRMTIGLDLPFTHFTPRSTLKEYTIQGKERKVTVQSIAPFELRFGLGGEYSIDKKFTPFIDLIGAVQWIQTSLTIDGEQVSYNTRSFGFSVRGGLRIRLRKWFFTSLSGQVGILGTSVWGAELSMGFRLF